MDKEEIKEINKRIYALEKQIASGFSRIGLNSDSIPVNGLFAESKEIKESCRQIEISLSKVFHEIEEMKKFKDSVSKELYEIKESLKGNVTLSGIHKFLMQIPAIATALGIIGGILIYFFKG